MSEIAACTLIQEEPDRKTERYMMMFKDYPEDVKRALCCADNKATKLLRELEKFGLIERKRRGLGKPSLVYVKNFSAESSKSIFQNRDFHDSGGFKNASQDPSKSRCNKTKDLLIFECFGLSRVRCAS